MTTETLTPAHKAHIYAFVNLPSKVQDVISILHFAKINIILWGKIVVLDNIILGKFFSLALRGFKATFVLTFQ